MTNRRNTSRNIAMMLTSAMVLTIAGAVGWILTAPQVTKHMQQAAAVTVRDGVSVIDVPVDDAAIEFLTVAEVKMNDHSVGAYPTDPQPLAKAAQAWVEEQIAQFDERAGQDDEISLDWSTVLHAGPFLGFDLVSTRSLDGHLSREHHTLYTEVGTDHVWTAKALVTDDAADRLGRVIRHAVKAGALRSESFPSIHEARDLAEVSLEGVRITPDGIVVPLAGADVALSLENSGAPQDPGAGVLTKAGEKLFNAAAAGEEFVGLPAPKLPNVTSDGVITFPVEGGVDCSVERCIALTFDDGPEPGTNRLLDILRDEDVRATFFLIGSQVPGQHGIVQRMVSEGHIVGNHTWMHPDLATQSRETVRSQISRTTDAIVAAGAPEPLLFRPPYGSLSDPVRADIAAMGYATMLWDVDTLDWVVRDTQKITDAALRDARPGGIILMHDIHNESIDAVPAIIDGLREKGLTIVTIPELFGGEVKVGGVYRNSH